MCNQRAKKMGKALKEISEIITFGEGRKVWQNKEFVIQYDRNNLYCGNCHSLRVKMYNIIGGIKIEVTSKPTQQVLLQMHISNSQTYQ